MPAMKIRVRYSGIEFVSDRTARETLKLISKIARRAQILELEYVLSMLELPLATVQSIRAKLNKEMTSAPVLEIQHARKGSWEILALIGAFGLWFLNATLGETLKEGWKRTEIHKVLAEYIATRPKKFERFIREAADDVPLEDKWEITGIRVKRRGKDTQYEINLDPSGLEKPKARRLIDNDILLSQVQRDIDRSSQ